MNSVPRTDSQKGVPTILPYTRRDGIFAVHVNNRKVSIFPIALMLLLGLAAILAACADIAESTPTPERVLSGPTIASSPTIFPILATNVSAEEYFTGANATAAALPGGGELPPLPIDGISASTGAQNVQITADDGSLITGVLYQSGIVRLPGVLILAAPGDEWGDFPVRLHNNGFTVLVVNLREGGGLADFEVAIRALSSGEADPGRLAVIGAGSGTEIALTGCAADLLCDTVVLLSPVGQNALLNAITTFNPRPLLVAASRDDADSFALAEALQTAARGEFLMQPFESAGRGTEILTNRPDMGDLIIDWLGRQLS